MTNSGLKKCIIVNSFKVFIIIFLFLSNLQIDALAMEAKLNIDDLIKDAFENNPEIKSLTLKYQASILKPAQEKALEDPMISLNSMNLPTNMPAFGKSMMTGLSLSIAQKTVYSEKLILKEKIAYSMSDIDNEMLLEKINSIKMDIKQSYYDLSYLTKIIELQKRNKDLLRDLSKITQARYITGNSTQQDVIKINTEISKINKNLIELNRKKDRIKFQINKLIYKPIFSPLKELKEPKLSKISVNFEKLKNLIYKAPDFKKAQLGKAISEYEIKLAELETIPDFDFMLGYTIAPDRADLLSAGISFNLPIWYKEKQKKMLEEKRYNYQAFLAEINSLENTKLLNLANIISKIHENEDKYDYLSNGILPQLQQSLKSAIVNYETGKTEFMSLLDTQREIIDTEMEIQMVLSEHEKTISELEFEIGSDLK